VFRKSVILFLLIVLGQSTAYCEIKNVGIPYIRNFTKHDYMAGAHNWDIAQDFKGFMYIANDDGLLVYNGVQWNLYRMPNLSMVRSVYIDDKGNIYVGAYNDIGLMSCSDNGKMTFSSLRDLIPEEYRNFDDVWNVFRYRNKIVFQSYNAAYLYDESGQVTVIAAPSRFQGAYNINGRLIFNDVDKGLMEYSAGRLAELAGCEKLTGKEIKALIPYGDDNRMLICTLGEGMFIYDGQMIRGWNIPVNEQLKKDQIFSATILHDNFYAIGTILNGLIIIDNDGNIVQHINKKKGLQNNTILDLYCDRAGNLWLALDNGIDYATIDSPVTFIQNSDGFGAGYASVIYKGRLYLGTNQGLYVKEWPASNSESDFKMISGTYGQVWYLGVHKGVLICGHNKGTFVVSGEQAELISEISVGWKYYELKSHPGYMIGGTSSGIILFRWDQGKWKFVRQIKGFNESFRVFEEDEHGDIWMSHGFKGIFMVRLDEGLDSVIYSRFYNSSDGLPSDYYLNIFKIKGKIIVTSETEIYEYVPAEDSFTRSIYFNRLLSPLAGISYLMEDQAGNIWYVAKNRTGVFRMDENFNYQQITSPFLLLSGKFIHGFESIYPYSSDHVFFGTEDGFAHYSPDVSYKGYKEFSAYITRGVAILRDTVFYYGKVTGTARGENTQYAFPYNNNSFRFTFASPVYDNAGNTEYSYRLSGFNDEWSTWSKTYEKEYTNLPDGRFTFQVRARNQLGVESLPDSLEFIVLHPWYKTAGAYIAYVLLFLSMVLAVLWAVNKRIEAANLRERLNNQRIYDEREQEYNRKALEAEKEIIRIRNENLQAEMIQRDKELANQAMNLVRKNEFLAALKDEMNRLKMTSDNETVINNLSSIISKINREVDSNRQREVFETAFDEVHEDFLNKLKTKYPTLTPTELRLCAFLKMNISTKEIAPLMNISVRGVEICRYRIRKKMQISRDTNLTGLLSDI
jgi:ligand-binding sensor domain-containing protein/DNA-binding CsgD family transcriptional regulator